MLCSSSIGMSLHCIPVVTVVADEGQPLRTVPSTYAYALAHFPQAGDLIDMADGNRYQVTSVELRTNFWYPPERPGRSMRNAPRAIEIRTKSILRET